MIHATNTSATAQIFEGYTVPLGYSVLPGSPAVLYIHPNGLQELKAPDYLQSFALGMLVTLPFAVVLVIRRVLAMLKPSALDRYI